MGNMYLYHYYDKRSGPFKSLTGISAEQAKSLLEEIKAERPESMCALRNPDYIDKRLRCESIIRKEFLAKGGIVEKDSPHYMVLRQRGFSVHHDHSFANTAWNSRGTAT